MRADDRAEARAYAGYALALEVLRSLHEVLSPAGLPVMPLKGVLLQASVYRPPWRRRLTDVDVLVPEAACAEALARLTRREWACSWGPQGQGKAYHPKLPLPVDIHATLFPPGVFRMRSADVFARACVDEELFGFTVRKPDPHDVYAHLVGHFAWGRLTPSRSPMQAEDLLRVPQSFALQPKACAAHLHHCGLGRGARYTLELSRARGDAFAAEVLKALPSDPLGDVAAGAARYVLRRLPSASKWGALPVHLLNSSLPQAVYSATRHLDAGLRRNRGGPSSAAARGARRELI